MQNLTEHIGVRFPARDYRLLKQIARARGMDVSDYIRCLIYTDLAELSYLDETRKKALGIAQAAPKGERPR